MSKKLITFMVTATVLASCSSTKEPAKEVVASDPVVSSAPVVAPVASAVMNNNAVFFAFNKYDIKDDYRGIVDANASHISGDKTMQVQVQGNTDDIGSVEYNLALGQKRADAVKKALIASGVDAKQVETVSNGKLKPKFDNTQDQGRAENRRADVFYKNGQPNGYHLDNGVPMVNGDFYNGTVPAGVLD